MQSLLGKIFSNTDSKGFSLLELLVAVTLIGIIAAISAPRMVTYMANADFRADVRGLLGAMKHARMEAVKRNTNCALTFYTDAAGFDFFATYVDFNENFIQDAGETLLINGVFKNAVVSATTLGVNTDGDNSIAFNSRGLPLRTTGGFGAASVTLANSASRQKAVRGAMVRSVSTNVVGRLRIQ